MQLLARLKIQSHVSLARSFILIKKEYKMILDPGFDLTLRPMKYPVFYEMYRNAIKNTWTVEEVESVKTLLI